MKYNFDAVTNRRNTGSLKWDVAANEIPMWVADMDFQTAPAVIDAIKKKAELGIFGYNIIPDSWFEAIEDWWKNRHQFTIHKDWLIFTTGVIPAVTCAVKRMTNVGDNVVIQTPIYDIFFHSIENHGRHVLENKLSYDSEKLEYCIDFEDLEKKLAHPLTTLMILCNPHNPVGKIWSKEELAKIGELCKKYHVIVLSDEIHCDITDIGVEYTPFASVSEVCRDSSITCISATKAFNIAGLQTAAVFIPSEEIRNKMERGLNSDEVAEPNSFAIDAVVAAFTKGGEWLDSLREYIECNKQIVKEYLENNLPEIKHVPSQATYLLWLDMGNIVEDTDEICAFIRKETGLYLTAGGQYRGNGARFIRMNVACQKAVVESSLELFKKGIMKYRER